MRGQLRGAQSQPVQGTQHVQVTIQVERSLEIKESGGLSGGRNASNVIGVKSELDSIAVSLDLIESEGNHSESVLYLLTGKTQVTTEACARPGASVERLGMERS